jgi:hypothetical protein
MFKDAEGMVMPEIFNDEYLDLDTQYQGISYWQCNDSETVRSQVQVVPAIVEADTSDAAYGTQVAGASVSLDYVVGMICDVDAMLTDFQIETARTTSVEARKGYRNTWLHIAKNGICDPTENTILFIMDDSGVTP